MGKVTCSLFSYTGNVSNCLNVSTHILPVSGCQGRNGPNSVIFQRPIFKNFLCFGQAVKPMLVEAFRTEFFIKAFYITILHGLPRIDKYMLHFAIVRPGIHNIARKFRAVIRQYFFGQPALLHQ